MRTALSTIVALGFVMGMAASAQAVIGDPPSWDLMDFDFGNGVGEVPLTDDLGGAGVTDFDDITETLGADVTTLDFPGSGANGFARAVYGSFFPGGDISFTAEWRGAFRPMDVSNGNPIEFRFFQGSRTVTVAWFPDQTIRNLASAGGDYITGTDAQNAGFDWADVHTYRLVLFSAGGGSTAELYVDNALLGTVSGASGSGNNFIDLLANNEPDGNSMDLNYLRVATGEFIPIPEPATIGLLGLGGLLVLRRRMA